MPRSLAIDDDEDVPRRRRRRDAAVDTETERNLFMRVILHSPRDTVAGTVALATVAAIVFNAVVLQSGHHPAPMFRTAFPSEQAPVRTGSLGPAPAPATNAIATVVSLPSTGPLPRPRPAEAESRPADIAAPATVQRSSLPAAPPRPPAAIPVRHDPVGDLIVSNRRVMAVQRALTEFGYGQLKPTGIVGPDTEAAIRKFEKGHGMAPTGQVSDRLVKELASATGRSMD